MSDGPQFNPPEKHRSRDDPDAHLDSWNLHNDVAESASSDLSLETLHLRVLSEFLLEEYGSQASKMEIILRNKSITFDLLWHLFRDGTEITFKDGNSELSCAGRV